MKKVFVISAILLFVLPGWSQTASSSQQINIQYKNGQSLQIDANDIDYIEFKETESNPDTPNQPDTPTQPDTPVNPNGDMAGRYLTFVAQETGTFKFGGIRGNEGISYSLDDGSTWYTLARNTDSPTVSAGNKIMWKGLLTPLSSYEDGIGEFSSTGRFTVEGNIMSLLYGDDFQNKTSLSGKDFAFAGLFSSCTGLTSAENLVLPATTLANDCYRYMFYGCTSLTAAPSVLPATKLSFYCYEAMFSGCTSLTTAPELPATTLAYSCYSNMFEGCTSLTTAPNLPATALAKYCYSYMFRGCTSLNTVPSDLLPAAILADYCYEYMFYGCKKLYSPPILAAKTLVTGCYQYMFAETSLLEFLICLATDISATNCTTNWFQGNSGVRGHFYKAPGMNDWTRGQSGIKATWTIHDYSQ